MALLTPSRPAKGVINCARHTVCSCTKKKKKKGKVQRVQGEGIRHALNMYECILYEKKGKIKRREEGM